MNSEPEEINLLLNLAFGMILLFGVVLFGLIYWILTKTKVFRVNKSSHFFNVAKAAVLSVVGVFIIAGMGRFAIQVYQTIKYLIRN